MNSVTQRSSSNYREYNCANTRGICEIAATPANLQPLVDTRRSDLQSTPGTTSSEGNFKCFPFAESKCAFNEPTPTEDASEVISRHVSELNLGGVHSTSPNETLPSVSILNTTSPNVISPNVSSQFSSNSTKPNATSLNTTSPGITSPNTRDSNDCVRRFAQTYKLGSPPGGSSIGTNEFVRPTIDEDVKRSGLDLSLDTSIRNLSSCESSSVSSSNDDPQISIHQRFSNDLRNSTDQGLSNDQRLSNNQRFSNDRRISTNQRLSYDQRMSTDHRLSEDFIAPSQKPRMDTNSQSSRSADYNYANDPIEVSSCSSKESTLQFAVKSSEKSSSGAVRKSNLSSTKNKSEKCDMDSIFEKVLKLNPRLRLTKIYIFK